MQFILYLKRYVLAEQKNAFQRCMGLVLHVERYYSLAKLFVYKNYICINLMVSYRVNYCQLLHECYCNAWEKQ